MKYLYGQTVDIRELNERIESKSSFVNMITMGMDQVIVGQKHLVESLLIGLLSMAISFWKVFLVLPRPSLSNPCILIDAKYSNPVHAGSIAGWRYRTMIYSQKNEEFQAKQVLFANFVLADEINRAPAKYRVHCFEAMQERQVTISENTYKLPDPFLLWLLKTQSNKKELIRCSEAQVDRFMLKVIISYPKKERKTDYPREYSGEMQSPENVDQRWDYRSPQGCSWKFISMRRLNVTS